MSAETKPHKMRRRASRALMCLFWVVMALVLTGFGLTVCVVNVMSGRQLTRLSEMVANRALTDARVSIGSMELTMRATFPYLTLDIDSVLVLSSALHSLPADVRAELPAYGDTLFALEHFHGGVNLPAVLLGRLDLRDVALTAPEANVVIAPDGTTNFSIFGTEADTTASSSMSLPSIAINRFRIDRPRPLRFYDAVSNLWSVLDIKKVEVEGVDAPLYTLDFQGDLMASMLSEFGLERLPFSFRGGIAWDSKHPDYIDIDNFKMRLAIINMLAAVRVYFGNELIVERADIDVEPVGLTSVLALLPDSLLRSHGLTEPIRTNAAVGVNLHLDRPFNTSTQVIPYATARIGVNDSYFYYGKYGVDSLAVALKATVRGDTLSESTVELERLALAGPMTRLNLRGEATDIGPDPLLSGCLRADAELAHMPKQLLDLLQGAASGRLDADIDFVMRPSMLTRAGLHRLRMRGDLDAHNLRWLSDDTISQAYVGNLCLRFGTNESLYGTTGSGIDSLLAAKVKVDSANVLYDNYKLATRSVDGLMALRPHRYEGSLPLMVFDLGVGRLRASDRNSRLMVRNANVHFNAQKLPPKQRKKRLRRQAASIAVDSMEVIDWGTSSQMRKLLLGWDLNGSISASRGSVFTPHFPLRTRVRNLNVKFNNDTVRFDDITVKSGRSDLTASGIISNIKRSLTSRSLRSPLKVNLDVISDTIDVNQLATTIFTGSAYAADERLRHRMADSLMHATDEALEQYIEDMVKEVPDTAHKPLLVPVNVDAELKLKAGRIIYSDMMLSDLRGRVLMYDGALNLHGLRASSDFGSVDLSALYSAPTASDMRFGFGLNVDRFYLDRFLRLVPAVDSIMPLLRSVSGIVNAQIAATVDIDRQMNFVLPSLNAVVKLEGDSLRLLPAKTFNTLAKWLLFKDKKNDMIRHMSVEMLVSDSEMEVYPFVFDFDRYRIGVQGYNTLGMDLDYHISILKSPIPFKFGINLTGTPEKLKVRLGRARFNEKKASTRVAIADTTRINLLQQIEKVFRRGVRNSKFAELNVSERPERPAFDQAADTLSHADSLLFIREGLLPPPPVPPAR